MTKPQPLTPAAERKRQQRARAAAGQVHRVAVYLTESQKKKLDAYLLENQRMFPEGNNDASGFIGRVIGRL